MDYLTGQTIRGYQIKEKIGEGGFAVVYRALREADSTVVAFKHIHAELARKQSFVERFDEEAVRVAQLRHPHIVSVHECWREPHGVYFVMEWIQGTNLRLLIRERGAQPFDLAARVVDQIAAALHAAHMADILHRDVKPANILLDVQGSAYLNDFDIARSLKRMRTITIPGAQLGTPAYSAPELLNKDPLSPRTDIYALGMTVYELLAGAHPYAHAGPLELLMKQMREPVPPLQDYRPEAPAALNDVLQRATAKAPDGRYDSVLAFRDAFLAALSEA